MRHLILNLESPLMAFGGETIDNYGVIRPFPAASMLTGLLANALGWRRVERNRHQELQDRLVFATRIDREPAGGRMTDYQTALLYEDDQGWTTRGQPDGRNKSPSYQPLPPDNRRALTWQRYRDFWVDMRVSIALRLEPPGETPTLEDLASALQEPARPLFVGRKPCLPSESLFGGFVEGDSALAAILSAPLADAAAGTAPVRLLWPDGEGADGITPNRTYMLTDQRNWTSGLHGGGRAVCEGTVDHGRFSVRPETSEQDKKDERP